MLKYNRGFSLITIQKVLNNKHKEDLKEQIAFNIAKDLTKWLIENDYIKFEFIYEQNKGFQPWQTLPSLFDRVEVRGSIDFELVEIPRKYKKEIIIEKYDKF